MDQDRDIHHHLPPGVTGAVLPQHTQRALAACASEVSDDRAPKDLDFLMRHAHALRPRTALGWVVCRKGVGLACAAS